MDLSKLKGKAIRISSITDSVLELDITESYVMYSYRKFEGKLYETSQIFCRTSKGIGYPLKEIYFLVEDNGEFEKSVHEMTIKEYQAHQTLRNTAWK